MFGKLSKKLTMLLSKMKVIVKERETCESILGSSNIKVKTLLIKKKIAKKKTLPFCC